MLNHTPHVSSKYGAPMGRAFRTDAAADIHLEPGWFRRKPASVLQPIKSAFAGKISLRRLRLDRGGYDSGGAYWGFPNNVYSALSECGTVDMTLRARDRAVAKATIRGEYPKAHFFR